MISSARPSSGKRRSTTSAAKATATTSCCYVEGRHRAEHLARPGPLDAAKSLRASTSTSTEDNQRGQRLLAVQRRSLDKRPPDADYVILADPEGNRFCVVDIS